MHMNPGP